MNKMNCNYVRKSDVEKMYGESCLLSGECVFNLVKEICSEREEISRLTLSLNEGSLSSYETLKELKSSYEDNRNKIIRNFTQYAASIVNKQKFYDTLLTRQDLFQASMVGVCRALNNVDLSKCSEKTIIGYFMSYMYHEMITELTNTTNQFMKFPTDFKKAMPKLYKETNRINEELEYSKNSNEYLSLLLTNAELFGLDKEDVRNYHLSNALLANNVNGSNDDEEKSEEEAVALKLGNKAMAKQNRSVEDNYIATEARENFWVNVYGMLPEGYGEAVYRKYVLEEDQNDIASDYGITPQALGKRIKKARSIIGKCRYSDFDVNELAKYDNSGWLID